MIPNTLAEARRRGRRARHWCAGFPSAADEAHAHGEDDDEYARARRWIGSMPPSEQRNLGRAGGTGYDQDWMVIGDLAAHTQPHEAVTACYRSALVNGLPSTFSGQTIANAGGGFGDEFVFGQVRYFPPATTALDGSTVLVSLDQAIASRGMHCFRAVVDVVHTRHEYATPINLTETANPDSDPSDLVNRSVASRAVQFGRMFALLEQLRRDALDGRDSSHVPVQGVCRVVAPAKTESVQTQSSRCVYAIGWMRIAFDALNTQSPNTALLVAAAVSSSSDCICMLERACVMRQIQQRLDYLRAMREAELDATSDLSSGCAWRGDTLQVAAFARASDHIACNALRHDHARLLVRTDVRIDYQTPLTDVPSMIGGTCDVPMFGSYTETENPLSGSLLVNGRPQLVTDQIAFAQNEVLVTARSDAARTIVAECRCLPEDTPFNSTDTLYMFLTDNKSVYLNVPRFNRASAHGSNRTPVTKAKPIDIPLGHILSLLGVTSAAQFETVLGLRVSSANGHCSKRSAVVPADLATWLASVISKCTFDATDDVARIYAAALGKTGPTAHVAVRALLVTRFASHCVSSPAKTLFLARMLMRIAVAAVRDEFDDRDAASSTVLVSAGETLAVLYRQLARKWDEKASRRMEYARYKGHTIDSRFATAQPMRAGAAQYHLKTGHFSVNSDAKQGVMQVRLEGTNPFATRAHAAINTKTFGKQQRQSAPRELQADEFGGNCPANTPEGGGAGRVGARPFCGMVSNGVHGRTITLLLSQVPGAMVIDESSTMPPCGSCAFVMVNGAPVLWLSAGVTPAEFAQRVRENRRCGQIPFCVSVAVETFGVEMFAGAWPEGVCVHVRTGRGRRLTALYVASHAHCLDDAIDAATDGGRIALQAIDGGLVGFLINRGVVECLDVHEMANVLIADSRRALLSSEGLSYGERYTHALLDPSTLLSLAAGIVPWVNTNQTPRIIYMGAHLKSAAGAEDPRFPNTSALSMTLCNTQRALVRTRVEEVMETVLCVPIVYSTCVIAAWMTWDYTNEDAIVVSKGAVDRGCMAHIETATIVFTVTDRSIVFKKPREDTAMRKTGATTSIYDALDDNGLPRAGATVNEGDVILGKVRYAPQESGLRGSAHNVECCCSEVSRHAGRVVTVGVSSGIAGARVVTIQLSKYCPLQAGDKFSNRHGQKGCVALVVPDEDMPFTQDGMRPDIIVNPHSFSRMTPAHFMEALAGKAAAVAGCSGVDATGWTDPIAAAGAFGHILSEAGYDPMGTEQLTCGKTGVLLKGKVFMGPVATMTLNHLVAHKVHARGRTGPVNQNTRQPADGKSKKGGQRRGEMEAEVHTQHGVAAVVQELNQSDAHTVYVCRQCRSVAHPPPTEGTRGASAYGGEDDCTEECDMRATCPQCGPDHIVRVGGTWSSYGLALPVMAGLGIRTELETTACIT